MLTPAALETLSQAIDRAHEVAAMLNASNIITAGEYTSIASGLHAAWQLHQEYARLLADLDAARAERDEARADRDILKDLVAMQHTLLSAEEESKP